MRLFDLRDKNGTVLRAMSGRQLGRGLLVAGLVASLTTIAAAPAQAATLVALWHMDEAESGIEIMRDCATDDGANDGTTSNVVAGDSGDPTVAETECESAPDQTPGGNHGYFFDGTAPESEVTVPDAASLNPGIGRHQLHCTRQLHHTSQRHERLRGHAERPREEPALQDGAEAQPDQDQDKGEMLVQGFKWENHHHQGAQPDRRVAHRHLFQD